jgi:hypothetical protein
MSSGFGVSSAAAKKNPPLPALRAELRARCAPSATAIPVIVQNRTGRDEHGWTDLSGLVERVTFHNEDSATVSCG